MKGLVQKCRKNWNRGSEQSTVVDIQVEKVTLILSISSVMDT